MKHNSRSTVSKMNEKFWDCYQTANTINRSLQCDRNYKTNNYNIAKTLVGNRGSELGYDEKRVRQLVRMILSGLFLFEMSVVQINSHGISLDGNNRIEAARRTGTYFLFRVLTSAIYNQTEPEKVLSVINRFNNYNPTSSANEQYKSALIVNSPLAQRLSDLRALKGLSHKDITINQMMTIVERNKQKTHSRKRGYDDYFDEEYTAYAMTPQFENEFDLACKVIEYFRGTTIQANTVLKQVLFMMWDDNKFDINRFSTALLKGKLVLDLEHLTPKTIRAAIGKVGVVRNY